MGDITPDEKYLLSVREAMAYFGIGEKTIRKTLRENPQLYVQVGVKKLVNKKKYEAFLDRRSYL